MSSDSSFPNFIQVRDADSLQVYMINENHRLAPQIERNNRALFEACRDGSDEICKVLISLGADVNSVVDNQRSHLCIACKNVHSACVCVCCWPVVQM